MCDILCPAHIERAAQRYVGQLIARSSEQPSAAPDDQAALAPDTAALAPQAKVQAAPVSSPSRAATSTVDLQSVDIASMVDSLPRSVGVEHAALHAIAQLGLVEKLTALGINGVMRACILSNLIGRIAAPGSELATWDWLVRHSALGELLDVDFEGLYTKAWFVAQLDRIRLLQNGAHIFPPHSGYIQGRSETTHPQRHR